MKIDAVVLAAGRGTRMRSNIPKVLHPIAGKPMLAHVISAARALQDSCLSIVVGHGADKVKALDNNADIAWVMQQEQLGTGHAVKQSVEHLRDDAVAVILYGDVPLIQAETLSRLCEAATKGQLAVLTVKLAEPTGYGRIIRDANDRVCAIVEQKDADPSQLLVNEVNTGFMAVPVSLLKAWLPKLSNDNAQQEYYLTDLVEIAVSEGVSVVAEHAECEQEVQGVNDRLQLAQLERWHQENEAYTHLRNGLAISDPRRFDVRGVLSYGVDSSVDINTIFHGNVQLGNNVKVGPNCVISNAVIGDNVEIKENSVIEDASVADDSIIGPFARLRPGSRLGKASKVGNFVEIKNTNLGDGSKVNHLAYVGDADIGINCNIGAGTITCNYDGANKHKTTLGDGVFVGSNSTLVAPVEMQSNAFVGAGSTVTKTVASNELAISRAKQRNISGWNRPEKGK